VFDSKQNLSLRRGISVLIGWAFEQPFCSEGREFEQANLQRFKCPVGCPGGMLKLQIDRHITELDVWSINKYQIGMTLSAIAWVTEN